MPTDLAVQHPSGMQLLAEMARKTSDPQAAIELAKQIVELETKREAFLQDRERFEWQKLDREARVAFAASFQKFKEDAPKILKTKHVYFEGRDASKPATSYWHVELDKACDLLIPALLKVDITHRWKSSDLPGGMTRVTCFLRHRLGHEEEGASLAGPSDTSGGKNAIQGVGSATSYLERYTFLATCGIVASGKDDDGLGGNGITQEHGATLVASISGGETAVDVMGAWTSATNEAKNFTPIDYRAMTIFTEARDERLRFLKRGK
jgi:ERF superfamily